MSNNTSNNKSTKKENDAVTAVEVVKDDTVVYEDGDFDDYNADHNYDTDDSSKEDESKKDNKSNKDDKSDKDSKSDQKR